MGILEHIEHIDQQLFLYLNSINSDFWDIIFSWITNKYTWFPLYFLMIGLMAIKNKWKTFYILLFAGITVGLCDLISVHLFKNVFERYRPCHNLDIGYLVHTINGKCGGKFGFISSHATNSFGVAIFAGKILNRQFNFSLKILLPWAAIVAYSRVYVGVHYPSDIVVGSIVGTIIALTTYKALSYCNKRFNWNLYI